jgi:hypothetical protein
MFTVTGAGGGFELKRRSVAMALFRAPGGHVALRSKFFLPKATGDFAFSHVLVEA